MIQEIQIDEGQIFLGHKPKSWVIFSADNNASNINLAKAIAGHHYAVFFSKFASAEALLNTTDLLTHSKYFNKRSPISLVAIGESAAAALTAAAIAAEDTHISTVISLNGRLNLVEENILTSIHVPILLMVENDLELIKINETAAEFIPYCEITLGSSPVLVLKWLAHHSIIRKKKIWNHHLLN